MIQSTTQDFDMARSDARIRAALDGIITIDSAGVVVEWNPAAERIFGYPAGDAVGRSMGDLIVPPHMRSAHNAGMAKYLATGDGPALDQRLEMPAMTADGRQITIELTITAFTASGRQWFTGWARDITEIKRTEEELAQSERRFQAIVEHSSDVITILDAEGRWLYTSAAGTRITGYPKGHEPEGGIMSLLHPDDVELADRTLGEILSGTRGPDEPVELRIVGRHGAVHHFETVGINMLDDPAVRGVVLHARDVTERRVAEENLAVRTKQLEGLLTNLSLGVLVEDEHRHVIVANQAFADLFGIPAAPAELVGADCVAMAEQGADSFADAASFGRDVDRCIAQRVPVAATEVMMRDGRILERDYVPVLGGDDEVRGHIWLYRDVTDRKQVEAERERMLAAEREARLSTEAAQTRLKEQNQSLRELDRLKTELVATVSHELRTPLTSIVSFSELLDDPDAGELTENQVTFVGTIRRNADRLIRVVDDLLLLARLESETISLEAAPCDIGRVVRTVIAGHQPAAAAKGIMLDVVSPDGMSCVVDAARIEQVVDNLIANAVKFTSKDGAVTVRSSLDGVNFRLQVSDTGIGIPANEVDQLFSRFFRATNARTAMISGTGLGLAACKAIVRLHGGTIDVTSEQDVGTIVTVNLPCVEVSHG